MILSAALVTATVFDAGTFLLLQRDLFKVVVGIIMVSNSATLFIILGLSRGQPPIYPSTEPSISDPLVQAAALTALIIGLGAAGDGLPALPLEPLGHRKRRRSRDGRRAARLCGRRSLPWVVGAILALLDGRKRWVGLLGQQVLGSALRRLSA